MAEFNIEVADEMPKARSVTRASEFEGKLRFVVENHAGKAVRLATFDKLAGAARTKASMKNGKIECPGGYDNWTVAAVKQTAEVTKENLKEPGFEGLSVGDVYETGGGELWVQYNGPVEGAE